MADDKYNVDWTALLKAAVTEPGILAQAYRTFHRYSFLNQLHALLQCQVRGIQPGPIASYRKWQELGRQVQKGEKAITLCLPVKRSFKKKVVEPDEQGNLREVEKTVTYRQFLFRPNWFVLTQTEGKDVELEPVPDWNPELALATLDIARVPFEELDGNIQGYAFERKIALNPVADHAVRTLWHEAAHIVLGHTAKDRQVDGKVLTRDIRELEAESVALLLCATFGLNGIEESRGYIQNWFHGDQIPEKSVQRIFAAADKIIKAGQSNARPSENGDAEVEA